MRALLVTFSFLFVSLPSYASAAKAKSDKASSGTIIADVVELRAGPGAAYISRGRAYKGEPVRILETSDTGEWLRVEANALTGWLPARSISVDAAPVPNGSDAGRDRRQSNYLYDKSGRRRGTDGKAMGSGEGFGDEPTQDRIELPESPVQSLPMSASKKTISIQLGVGAGILERHFQAGIAPESYLANLDVSGPGLSTHLALEWRPLPFLVVSGFGRDTRLSTVEVIRPGDLDGTTVELATEAQQIGVNLMGSAAMGPFWVRGGLGGRYLRHAFRETKPVVILLTTSAQGVAGIMQAGAHFDAFEMRTSFAYVHPISIEQSPETSGNPEGSILELSAQARYRLSPFFSLYAETSTTLFDVDYQGRGTQRDTVTEDRALVYEAATEDNLLTGFTVGVCWSN